MGFTRILYNELRRLGATNFLLSIYVNDLGLAMNNIMELVWEMSTDLGNILGMIYKTSKDEMSTTTMTYIGFEVDTGGHEV